jgi:hypothetical protein
MWLKNCTSEYFVGICVIHIHAKFHMPRSGYLLIIAIVVTAKEIVRTSAILFYVLKKKTATEVAYFPNIYEIIKKHFRVLSSHVALVSVAPHK